MESTCDLCGVPLPDPAAVPGHVVLPLKVLQASSVDVCWVCCVQLANVAEAIKRGHIMGVMQTEDRLKPAE